MSDETRFTSRLVRLAANTVALGTGAVVGSQLSLRAACCRSPRPLPHQLAAVLDHPLRLRYRNPIGTLDLYGFAAGMQVLDLGCGTGTFTVEIARMVGSSGAVHAVDLQGALLAKTGARLAAAGLAERVRLHHAGAYALPLDDDSIDLAVLIATLSEIPDRLRALVELRRVLKPGARVAVSEELPSPCYLLPGAVRAAFEEAGFLFKGRTGSPFCYNMLFLNLK